MRQSHQQNFHLTCSLRVNWHGKLFKNISQFIHKPPNNSPNSAQTMLTEDDSKWGNMACPSQLLASLADFARILWRHQTEMYLKVNRLLVWKHWKNWGGGKGPRLKWVDKALFPWSYFFRQEKLPAPSLLWRTVLLAGINKTKRACILVLTGPELELRMRLLRSWPSGQSSWRNLETLEKPDEAPHSKTGLWGHLWLVSAADRCHGEWRRGPGKSNQNGLFFNCFVVVLNFLTFDWGQGISAAQTKLWKILSSACFCLYF